MSSMLVGTWNNADAMMPTSNSGKGARMASEPPCSYIRSSRAHAKSRVARRRHTTHPERHDVNTPQAITNQDHYLGICCLIAYYY